MPLQQGSGWVTWAKKLVEMIAEPGRLAPVDVTDIIIERPVTALPPASPVT
jgi:hypothetical protein